MPSLTLPLPGAPGGCPLSVAAIIVSGSLYTGRHCIMQCLNALVAIDWTVVLKLYPLCMIHLSRIVKWCLYSHGDCTDRTVLSVTFWWV